MTRKKRQSDTVKKAIVESNQDVYTDLEPNKDLKWKFKNPNRKVLIGRYTYTQEDLDKNQKLAEYLIDKGLSDLLCYE